MKKFLFRLIVALLAFNPSAGFAADTSLPNMTATTSPATTDILYVVVDPAGTPLDRKVTVANLLAGGSAAIGPATATDGAPALFNGTTGKLLKNSTPTGTGNPVMATSPTLITPILGVASATSITLPENGEILGPAGRLIVKTFSGTNASYSGTTSWNVNNAASTSTIFSVSNDATRVSVGNIASIQWSTTTDAASATYDLYLFRDAAGILAQRNGANAQKFRVGGTWINASNYEYAALSAVAGTGVVLAAETAGTGADNLNVSLMPAGTGSVLIGTATDSAGFGASLAFIAQSSKVGTAKENIGVIYKNSTLKTGLIFSSSENAAYIQSTWGAAANVDLILGGINSAGTYQETVRLTSAGTTAFAGGFGYATGSGGTVTQITSRSTGVTLNKVNGQITTTADSLAALAIVTFTVTNSAVAATDTIILSKVSGDIDTSAWVSAVAAGSFNISLRNNDAVGADVTALVLNFAVIKAVTS